MIKRYIKMSVWDAFLCVAASAALNFAFMQSVYIPDSLTNTFFPILLLCAVWQIFLFTAAYSKKTVVAALVLCVCAAAFFGILVGAGTLKPDAYALYLLLTLLASALVFLLSRKRAGAVVLSVTGVLVIGAVTFLQYGSFDYCLLLFLFSSGCLVLFRNHRLRVMSGSNGKRRQSGFAAITGCICIAAVLLSMCTYFVVIRPVSPPTRELKLVTRLMTLPILEQLGLSSHIFLLDPDRAAAPDDEDSMLSDEEAPSGNEDADRTPPPEEAQEREENVFLSQGVAESFASAVRYFIGDYRWLAFPIAFVLIIAAFVLLKKLHRRQRLKFFSNSGKKGQVTGIYNYLMEKLPLAGLPPVGCDTAFEYCARVEPRMDRIFQSGLFTKLTEIFCRTLYGKYEPSDDEYAMFVRCYNDFPADCRRNVGLWRFVIRFFKL